MVIQYIRRSTFQAAIALDHANVCLSSVICVSYYNTGQTFLQT